jgi:ribosomal protein L44E
VEKKFCCFCFTYALFMVKKIEVKKEKKYNTDLRRFAQIKTVE